MPGTRKDAARQNAAETLVDRLLLDPNWRERVVHVERLPARPPAYADLETAPAVASLLKRRGIPRLFTHQVAGIAAVRGGANVAVTTPTASGKSLVYLVPLLERRLAGELPHALYLSPLKALAQDQRRMVEELGGLLPRAMRLTCALYDGDTPSSARGKVRSEPPALVMSNPDMVHLSLLPSHASWKKFLRGLEYVIIDEAHTYRGVFGSHVSGILRRLKRVCALYGSSPRFVVTSATMRNPDEFLGRLTGERFTVVSESGAPSPPRFFALVKPRANVYTESCELLETVLRAGLKTITFTKARKITELLQMWLAGRARDLAPKVKAYRAGYLPEDRRALERALSSDRLEGIISTSALELGIDIGGLDACILVGFPGTHVSTWQRAGRVGRGSRSAFIAMVGMEDALDLYYLAHPREFFDRSPERLVLDEANPHILKAHLACAAAEDPLSPGEEALFGPSFPQLVAELVAEGRLSESATERRWFCPLKRPQRFVNIRSAGESFTIQSESGALIGTVDGFRAFKECHPQAIYLHAGATLEVTRLHEDKREVRVREVDVDYYTQPTMTEDTRVLRVLDRRPLGPGHVAFGEVRVTTRVVGYERKLVRGGVMLSQHPLTLPPQEFETQAVWLEAPYEVQRLVQVPGLHLMGGLHALEHSMIALFPLFALCDRWDLGGISTPHHPDTDTAAVFIYDGVPGGVGLAKFAYGVYEELLAKTVEHVASCDCTDGCPSCIHSPKCGSHNSPLDKAAMLVLGRAFTEGMPALGGKEEGTTGPGPRPQPAEGPAAEPAKKPAEEPPVAASAVEEGKPRRAVPAAGPAGPADDGSREVSRAGPEPGDTLPAADGPAGDSPTARGHTLVFDLETQKLAEEVGGWDNKRQMRMSVGVVCDITAGEFREYMEGEVRELVDDLARAALVVGFNIRNFDYEVLSAYVPRARLDAIPTLDILESVHRVLKRRVRLDDLTKATLGGGKIADGLDAVRWFRERNLVKLIEYCRHDVALTRDLYQYGLEHGHILYPSIQGTMKLPVDWK